MRTETRINDARRRWLKLKRHLRSCAQSTRALRDAARFAAANSSSLECLCLPFCRLAA